MRITWLGQAGLLLETNGTKIIIDPYLSNSVEKIQPHNKRRIAVGGIDENNIEEYLKAGVKGFGIGSDIVNKNIIENGEFDKITELCQKYTKVIEKRKTI